MWEYAWWGGVILVSQHHAAALAGVHGSPFGWVPKQNPDRTENLEEGRIVHDQQEPNAGTPKDDHPPARCATVAQVARQILWAKYWFPYAEVLIGKRDVARAFAWEWVHEDDVWMFASDLPGEPWGVPTDITALSLVLTFGWGGSPGEYQIGAYACKRRHTGHRPEDALWHGEEPFNSFWVVDDAVSAEARLGIRLWLSARCLDQSIRLKFGPHAINAKKMAMEG